MHTSWISDCIATYLRGMLRGLGARFIGEDVEDALTGVTVPERVVSETHAAVVGAVVEQPHRFRGDPLRVGSNQQGGACFDSLGALGGRPHDEHGLAESRGFLLEA